MLTTHQSHERNWMTQRCVMYLTSSLNRDGKKGNSTTYDCIWHLQSLSCDSKRHLEFFVFNIAVSADRFVSNQLQLTWAA
mmetsp:Transcript_17003/g.47753  ORF Transcript_17003/g.47753 Transcript_17003/m.47753 type:complete len:80 (-) Transcript_17003:1346-1585(-)